MIGSDTLTLFPGSQTLLGKQVSELVGDDLTVKADGSVVGTFHHVTGYTEFSSEPDELESRYLDLQFRVALAIYNKQGGEFETAHTENGVSRSYGSEGIPQELLLEVTPLAKTMQ